MYTNNSEAENLTLSLIYYQKLLKLDFILLSWITGMIMFVLEAFIIVGNAFAVAVILLDPLKNIRRNASNHLVLSLAVADLLVGIIVCFFNGWWYIHYAAYNEDLFGAVQNNIGVGQFELVAISTANLLALGINRLIAIKVPLRYSYIVTKQRVRIVIVFTWLYFTSLSVVMSIFGPRGTVKQDFIFNCHGAVVFVGLVFTCSVVIHALHKQSNAMKELTGSSNTLRNIVEREKKVTKGTIIITMVYIVCFVPFFVFQLLEIFCIMCWIKFPEVLTVFKAVALLLVFFNSVVNPYIYAYRLPKYLEAFKYLGKKLLCRKSNVNPGEELNRAQVEARIDTATCKKMTSEETKL